MLGPATTTLDSISVLGANFRIDMSECQVGVPMGPLQACRIHVGFSPGRAALFSGQLQVSAGDDRLTIPLAGRAVQGQVLGGDCGRSD